MHTYEHIFLIINFKLYYDPTFTQLIFFILKSSVTTLHSNCNWMTGTEMLGRFHVNCQFIVKPTSVSSIISILPVYFPYIVQQLLLTIILMTMYIIFWIVPRNANLTCLSASFLSDTQCDFSMTQLKVLQCDCMCYSVRVYNRL